MQTEFRLKKKMSIPIYKILTTEMQVHDAKEINTYKISDWIFKKTLQEKKIAKTDSITD